MDSQSQGFLNFYKKKKNFSLSFIGTGKTVVGAYIVYWFSQLNSKYPWKLKELKDKEKREVILYCGPSNKSVDVVAGTEHHFEN